MPEIQWWARLLVAAPWVLLLIWWLSQRCEHKWELVDKTQLPSRLEEIHRQGWNLAPMPVNFLIEAAQVKVLLVIRCDKCGAAKIVRERS